MAIHPDWCISIRLTEAFMNSAAVKNFAFSCIHVKIFLLRTHEAMGWLGHNTDVCSMCPNTALIQDVDNRKLYWLGKVEYENENFKIKKVSKCLISLGMIEIFLQGGLILKRQY